MTRRRLLALCAVFLLVVTAGCSFSIQNGTAPADLDNATYDRPVEPPASANASDYPATVTFYNGSERVAEIYAETAASHQERYTGLSEHDSLEAWQGMVFVYDAEGSRAYVMRNMSFAIDIVYVTSEGCVQSANPAPKPAENETGEEDHHTYPGNGQYVVEVPMGVASNAVGTGDPVVLEYDGTTVDGRESCGVSQT